MTLRMISIKMITSSLTKSTIALTTRTTRAGGTLVPALLRSRRFNATATRGPSEPRTLKPSAFAFPSEQRPEKKNDTSSVESPMKTTEADDFNATRLTHGATSKAIAITPRALAKLNEIHAGNAHDSALQIQVESGGCHGFQYNLNLIDLDAYLAEVDDPHEVYVFERCGSDGAKARIVLDESSLMILQDSKLDYTKELIGSQFKIVDSPYTSTACGCGASFDFDFDKLEKKQQQLEQ
ncbi:uncharacterized protein LODBEIA_P31890 [Lodderomyces beijingensis]|uniref:Core domain-containing protein n=1 Tax=Lodderomyces beijingensis TaxID=1775926 RepID=A0ABP0ZLD7_9ASCO